MKRHFFAVFSLSLCALLTFSSCAKSPENGGTEAAEASADETVSEVYISEPSTAVAVTKESKAQTSTVSETAPKLNETQSGKPSQTQSSASTQKNSGNPTVAADTTKAYEYDMSHPAVKKVMSMVGKKHLCTEVAQAAVETVGLSGWKSFEEDGMTYYVLEPEGFLDLGPKVTKDRIQLGDILYYADGGRGVSHVAVYIGNGQAVHGNWTKDGVTKVANAFYREPTYIIHIDYNT